MHTGKSNGWARTHIVAQLHSCVKMLPRDSLPDPTNDREEVDDLSRNRNCYEK